MDSFKDRLRHAWNVFSGKDQYAYRNIGPSSTSRQDLRKFTRGNRQSIMSSALNRIAMDCAAIKIYHCYVNKDDEFISTIKSPLNDIFNLEANIDQDGRAFLQDVVMSMLDEGKVALVPIETDDDLFANGSFGITSMRTGKIVEFYPQHVKVNVYNEKTGNKEDVVLPKNRVGIVENPFYAVMNEPNSTLQRLVHKMNLIDYVDEQASSGKLNILIKLPYTLRTDYHKNQANQRKQELEDQLTNSKYGIAYVDQTEQITQLNRPIDNNLLEQIDKLTEQFYNQIGLTKSVFDGTASESEMLNYYSRTIEPIMSAICNELKRKFLTKNARTRGQSIYFFRDPFKLVPVEKIADIADKMTRNAILSSNELRGIVGYRPVDDDRADQLRNANLNETPGAPPAPSTNPNAQQYIFDEQYDYGDEYPEEQSMPLKYG